MGLLEAMESASLVALAAIVTVSILARIFSFRDFSYPTLIAFGAGYVVGAGISSAAGVDGLAGDAIKFGVALATMQATRAVVRKRVAAA